MEDPIRARSSETFGDGGILNRAWAELPRDALTNIFGLLPVKDRLLHLPLVCKSWKLAYHDPLCWQRVEVDTVDFADPSFLLCKVAGSSRLLESLLQQRCLGRLRGLRLPLISDPNSLVILAQCAPLLEKLDIPDSCADDEWAAYAAPLMPHITELNLSSSSNAGKLSHVTVEAFGRSCRGMVKLCINRTETSSLTDDSEALAIATHYPRLRHLELRGNPLSTGGLRAILENCARLESLDAGSCHGLRDLYADAALYHLLWSRLTTFMIPNFLDVDEPPPCSSDSD